MLHGCSKPVKADTVSLTRSKYHAIMIIIVPSESLLTDLKQGPGSGTRDLNQLHHNVLVLDTNTESLADRPSWSNFIPKIL